MASEEPSLFLQLTSSEIKVPICEVNGVVKTLTKTFTDMAGDVHVRPTELAFRKQAL